MQRTILYLILVIPFVFACTTKSGTDQEQTSKVVPSVPEIQKVSQLIQANPNSAGLFFQRGQLYYELQKYREALDDLKQALVLDSTWLDAWHLLADIYIDDLQSRKALETMEHTVVIFPDSIRSLLKLSEFQLILRQYNASLETLAKIHSMDRDNADAYFMKGMVLKEVGDTNQAITHFQEATKSNPRLMDAWINLGQLFESRDDSDAIRYLDAGLSVHPDHPLLMHAKAQYLARNGQIELAKATYRRLIDIDPLNAASYYDMGLLFLDQDSTKQARQHFDLAIRINPMLARAYFYRGWTNEILSEIKAARNDYQQAIRLNGNDQDAKDGLERIDRKK